MLQLFDGDDFQSDLNGLQLHAPPDGDMIDAFLTQVAESVDALWMLKEWSGSFQNPYFNCKAVNCFQAEGYNVYRIRPLKGRLSRYRVLYAYDCEYDDYYMLAIAIKKSPSLPLNTNLIPYYYDYEPEHSISSRIKREYDALGLPRLSS